MPVFIEQAFDVHIIWIISAIFLASVFIGIGKAGFGGGVGLVSPALYAQVMPVPVMLPLMLPLLIVGDWGSLYAWWKKWDLRNLWLLLPGTIAGVIVGALLLTTLEERYLRIGLGVISLGFVALQIARDRGVVTGEHFRPVWWQGTLAGMGAGFCSMLAHAAGPIITLYLIPQKLGKEKFVATTVIYYTCLNLIKLPFFIGMKLLTVKVAVAAIWLAPVVVLGVFLGLWMNRRVSEKIFTWVVDRKSVV